MMAKKGEAEGKKEGEQGKKEGEGKNGKNKKGMMKCMKKKGKDGKGKHPHPPKNGTEVPEHYPGKNETSDAMKLNYLKSEEKVEMDYTEEENKEEYGSLMGSMMKNGTHDKNGTHPGKG